MFFRAGIPAAGYKQLRAKRCLHSLLCVGRKFRVRDFTDLVGKLARNMSHVFKLLHVSLAEGTHQKMNAQLHAGEQRQLLFHA